MIQTSITLATMEVTLQTLDTKIDRLMTCIENNQQEIMKYMRDHFEAHEDLKTAVGKAKNEIMAHTDKKAPAL